VINMYKNNMASVRGWNTFITNKLLSDFIDSKMHAYISDYTVEGMYSQKYYASLLMLEGGTLRSIANSVCVSHETIRKWKMDTYWNDRVNDNIKEYKAYVVNILNKGREGNDKINFNI